MTRDCKLSTKTLIYARTYTTTVENIEAKMFPENSNTSSAVQRCSLHASGAKARRDRNRGRKSPPSRILLKSGPLERGEPGG